MTPTQALAHARVIIWCERRTAADDEFRTLYDVFGPLCPLSPRLGRIHPVEEYLMRVPHTQNVRERIARLNPDGQEEGSYPRGRSPRAMGHWDKRWGRQHYMPVREFVERFGRAAYDKVPRAKDGKRRRIPMRFVEDIAA